MPCPYLLALCLDVRLTDGMDHALELVIGGLAVGLLYGVFGVGSAFATPMLAVIGIPGMAAVVGPLPALLPGSAAGAWSYSRQGKVDWGVARAAVIGAFPAAIVGAVCSHWVGGPVLLIASGGVLFVVGLRIVRPGRVVDPEVAAARRANTAFVVTSAAGIGFASGLLANGGGFLLVPLFLLALGLDMNEAAGTSLVVAFAVTIPTLATHAAVGDVDWLIAGFFALGLVPGTLAVGQLGHRLPTARLRHAFGFLLLGFAVWFLGRQILPMLG
jgi:uncharacterized membrane protein YfcA